MKITVKTWICEPHPFDYDGFEQLALVQWTDCDKKRQHRTTFTGIGIIDGIYTARNLKVDENRETDVGRSKSVLKYIDMDLVDVKVAKRIFAGWTGQMPLSMFIAINKLDVPFRAYKQVPARCVVRTIGPIYYFHRDIIKTSIKKVRRPPSNVVKM